MQLVIQPAEIEILKLEIRVIPLYLSSIKWILKNKTKKEQKNTKPKQTKTNKNPEGMVGVIGICLVLEKTLCTLSHYITRCPMLIML